VTDSHPGGQSASGLLPTEWSVIWRSPATPDLIGVMVVCLDLP
jgi:hypothetical protein